MDCEHDDTFFPWETYNLFDWYFEDSPMLWISFNNAPLMQSYCLVVEMKINDSNINCLPCFEKELELLIAWKNLRD